MQIPTSIYLIGSTSNNAVKIGVSTNPKKRLTSLQTGSSIKLNLISSYTFPNSNYAYAIEKYLHTESKEFALNGEWFEFDRLSLLVIKKCLETLLLSAYIDSGENLGIPIGGINFNPVAVTNVFGSKSINFDYIDSGLVEREEKVSKVDQFIRATEESKSLDTIRLGDFSSKFGEIKSDDDIESVALEFKEFLKSKKDGKKKIIFR
jgi:predicted GIY-YIG superfamily endonuclease